MQDSYKDRVIVALDTDSFDSAKALVKTLKDELSFFKVGKELFISCGPDIIKMIKDFGGNVFLDLKLHDIPNTVSKAAKMITNYGVDIFNVHASGGSAMMEMCVHEVKKEAAAKNLPVPKMIAVTMLTSLTNDVIQNELNINNQIEDQVVHLAKLTKRSGMDGVVCSPKEISLVREALGKDFIVLTPGIRPKWAATNDQKRILTPAEAFEKGADYLVIGRPITQADDPVGAVRKIWDELGV